MLNIPDEMRENGVGPLLSAKAADEDILWSRLDQMSNACQHVRAAACLCNIGKWGCYNHVSRVKRPLHQKLRIAKLGTDPFMRMQFLQENSNFELQITGTNKGGIRSRLQGMSLFVPYSFMPKCPVDSRWSEEVRHPSLRSKLLVWWIID